MNQDVEKFVSDVSVLDMEVGKLSAMLRLMPDTLTTSGTGGLNSQIVLVNKLVGDLKLYKVRLRRCKRCGKLFVAETANKLYCCNDTTSKKPEPENQEQMDAVAVYQRKQTITTYYRTWYKINYQRYMRGKMTKENLDKLRVLAKALRDDAIENRITTEEFKQWLDEH